MKTQAGLAKAGPPYLHPSPALPRCWGVCLGAPEARAHMRMVNHGNTMRLQPPTKHATEPKSHSTGYRHFFKALMIKHIV